MLSAVALGLASWVVGCLVLAAPGSAQPAADEVHEAYRLRQRGRSKLPLKQAAAIERGLEWLAKHQEREKKNKDVGFWNGDDFGLLCGKGEACDGSGNPVHDVGLTALALLAFLSDGVGAPAGEHDAVVQRGLNWLVLSQSSKDGLIGTNASFDFIYDHVIATVALCEAAALRGGADVRRAAQRGLIYLKTHRHRDHTWRYERGGQDADTPLATWGVLAATAGKRAGLAVDERGLVLASQWYDEVTDTNTGRAGYTKRGEGSARHPGDHAARFPANLGEALTASALYGRALLGQRPIFTPVMQHAVDALLAKPPRWKAKSGSIDFYYWYHATYALHGIDDGEPWLEAVRKALIDNQHRDGHALGSWDPLGAWGEDGGRIYSTALGVLMLQEPYRFAEDPVGFMPPGPAFFGLRRQWRELRFDRFKTALERLKPDRLTDEERAVLPEIERRLQQELDELGRCVERLQRSEDYLLARAALQLIKRSCAGLAPADAARKALRHFETDPKIRAEVRAAVALQAALKRQKPRMSKRQRARVLKMLDEVVSKHEGTRAAAHATEVAARIRRGQP